MLKRILLGFFTSFAIVIGMATTTFAQSVSYQILKDGTGQTSYASAYFLNPANVVAQGNQYRVSIVVATKHELGRFPVKVGSINGQSPQINQSTSGDTDYYTITFTADNLSQKLSGTMRVDIDALDYHHNYGFGLKFDSSSLPALASSSSAPTQKSAAKATSSINKNTNKNADTNVAQSDSQTISTNSSSRTQKEQQSKAASDTSSSADKKSSAADASTTSGTSNKQNTSSSSDSSVIANHSSQPTPSAKTKAPTILKGSLWMYIVGGIVGGGVLIGLLTFLKRGGN